MSLHNGSDKIINNNRTAKATSAIPIAGILVAAALLLGLLSVIGSETAIAQQNMTSTNATAMNATSAGNATAMNATSAGNATAMNATSAGNATGNQTAAGNQTGTAATMGGNNTAGQLEGIFGGGQ